MAVPLQVCFPVPDNVSCMTIVTSRVTCRSTGGTAYCYKPVVQPGSQPRQGLQMSYRTPHSEPKRTRDYSAVASKSNASYSLQGPVKSEKRKSVSISVSPCVYEHRWWATTESTLQSRRELIIEQDTGGYLLVATKINYGSSTNI